MTAINILTCLHNLTCRFISDSKPILPLKMNLTDSTFNKMFY